MKTTRYIATVIIATSLVTLCGCHATQTSPISQYSVQRNAMFARLHRQSLGGKVRLSRAEMLADVKFESLKREARALWGDKPITAQSFLAMRERLADTQLYKFLQKMPKGAIHHVHPGAMGDYRRLIRQATYREDCYICREEGPNYGRLGFYGAAPNENWQRCIDQRKASANADKYDAELLALLTLSSDELLDHDRIWTNFEQVFSRQGYLVKDRDFYEQYVIESLRYLRDVEQVRHVELRTHYSDADQIDSWRRILNKVNDKGPRISIILTACETRYPRALEPEAYRKRISDSMLKFARLRSENRDLIAGYDIYAEEDPGYSNAFLASAILDARQKMSDKGWDLPLYLHAGETNRPASRLAQSGDLNGSMNGVFNDNVVDAILLGSRRIGHGVGLVRRPGLWDICRDRGIVVELNPVSNMILGYTEDLRDHVGVSLIAAGVPVSINSDDPAIFGYEGVSYDYLLAAVAWDLNLSALKVIAADSLKYSALGDPEKQAALHDWREMWDMFIMSQLSDSTSPAASEAEIESAAAEHMGASKTAGQQ